MIIVVAGETEPDLELVITRTTQDVPNPVTEPVDLTGRTVTLRLRRPDGTVVERSATPRAPQSDVTLKGRAVVAWQDDDLVCSAGKVRYHCETILDFGSPAQETQPIPFDIEVRAPLG